MEKSYRNQHRAPTNDGYSAPLPGLLERFGPDVLDQPDLYGACDEETLRQMTVAVENPQALVRIYRATPPQHLEINHGDWVTLSRAYAHDHGHVDGSSDWPVVFADVPAPQVWTDGNDPSEYGYGGRDLPDLVGYTEGEPIPAPSPALRSSSDPPGGDGPGFVPSRGARAERRVPPSMGPAAGDVPQPGGPR